MFGGVRGSSGSRQGVELPDGSRMSRNRRSDGQSGATKPERQVAPGRRRVRRMSHTSCQG
jgi:hypothetical protein